MCQWFSLCPICQLAVTKVCYWSHCEACPCSSSFFIVAHNHALLQWLSYFLHYLQYLSSRLILSVHVNITVKSPAIFVLCSMLQWTPTEYHPSADQSKGHDCTARACTTLPVPTATDSNLPVPSLMTLTIIPTCQLIQGQQILSLSVHS